MSDPRNGELAGRVADVLTDNPERHEQGLWLAADYWKGEVKLSDIAAYADEPLPDEPVDSLRPVCRSTGCVAGWTSVLAAPKDATVYLGSGAGANLLIDGVSTTVFGYAQMQLRLSDVLSIWMFDSNRERDDLIEVLRAIEADPTVSDEALFELVGASEDEDEDEDSFA